MSHSEQPQPQVVTLGETMGLVSSENPGPMMRGSSMRLSFGGSESNVAIGLRRLGIPCAWIGRVGDDIVGHIIERELAAEGVTTLVHRDPARPTGLMVKARRSDQFASVTYYRRGSAGSGLAPDDVPADILTTAVLLHVTGITPALSASASEAVEHAVHVASDAGVLISLDLNYRSRLWSPEHANVVYQRLLPQVDIVFGGEDEASIVVGDRNPESLAHALAEYGPKEVVIKRGASGALACAEGRSTTIPAVPVHPIDTVGAGDAFVAGYLASRLRNEPMARRLRTAVVAGALACLTVGDWEGLPHRDELELLDSEEPVLR
ncbi:2-dehydro-3-deoxygluconokinase [Marmoricola sp. URHA0025 HA25]